MKRQILLKKRTGQVWVETAIYTLVMLVLIGAVLFFARPKIQEIQDKTILEQTVEVMNGIDEKITSAADGATGNQRTIEIMIKRGSFQIDAINDKIVFEIDDSNYMYSEPGKDVEVGRIIARTEKTGKTYKVFLTMDYSERYDLKYRGGDSVKVYSKSTTIQKILVLNEGTSSGSKKVINFS